MENPKTFGTILQIVMTELMTGRVDEFHLNDTQNNELIVKGIYYSKSVIIKETRIGFLPIWKK